MARADFQVVLDACVLANYAVCDLFLRLAESPRLYRPRWSAKILEETERTHRKLGWPSNLADSFQTVLGEHFPESLVSNYEHLIDDCENDPKDRHVLACAIHCQAELIVTYNLKDFPGNALGRWRIEVAHPQNYLITLFELEPSIVLHRLEQIARKRNVELEDHLLQLGLYVPNFAQRMLDELGAQ
jgi:hypothetical protein